MLIAGEASGDLLGAELVQALRNEFTVAEARPTPDPQPLHASLEPRFFGAGGLRMAAAGVELAFDMTQHSVVGLSEVLTKYFQFRRLFQQLRRLALERKPEAIICVDFSGFNRRFAHAIRSYTRRRHDWFHNWTPQIVQYVSPQVWASREGRAYQLAQDYDLLLSIFPFEKHWYARRVPRLHVEFVGNPIVERYPGARSEKALSSPAGEKGKGTASPLLLLLPGSRAGEVDLHVPVMIGALALMRATITDLRARMVLPSEELIRRAKRFNLPAQLEVQTGGVPESLREAGVALASTGTVTLECAYFGVPTVALYKTSWSTYQVAKRIVKVKHLAMPNLLAQAEVFPEFIQEQATAENLARAGLELLQNKTRREQVKSELARIVASLGGPGATRRAAHHILQLVAPDLSPAPASLEPADRGENPV